MAVIISSFANHPLSKFLDLFIAELVRFSNSVKCPVSLSIYISSLCPCPFPLFS